ncbi:unnamed protein product [Arctogadus glacialis]
MWLVLRAELRQCLRLKFSPTKTIVSASLEGERNNGDTWRFPVLSHTRAAVESASLHRQEPTCSFRTDISAVTTWFLCLFSDYAILLDSFRFVAVSGGSEGRRHWAFVMSYFRIIQASANHLYPELRQAQRHGERAQPRISKPGTCRNSSKLNYSVAVCGQPAHGSLAAAVMIHRLAFGLRLNTLCGGTSDPWEALDEEEYVFDCSALKRLTNGPFRTRI